MAEDGKTPQFFRVIIPPFIDNGTLELPRKFVKTYGKCLTSHACLKLPTGSESNMVLKKNSNGKAWLDKGWVDFVDKYSITVGYFLVFKHEGESRFRVRIFDMSTTEIDYPNSSAGTSNKKAGEVKVEDSESESLYDCPPGFTKRLGTETAIERAKAKHFELLKREGSFMIYMSEFYVSPNPRVHIHAAHSRTYLMDDEENTIILHVSNASATWPVNCKVSGKLSSNRKARFTQGWKTFASDNHLRAGDICIFDMINGNSKEYKVTISRGTGG